MWGCPRSTTAMPSRSKARDWSACASRSDRSGRRRPRIGDLPESRARRKKLPLPPRGEGWKELPPPVVGEGWGETSPSSPLVGEGWGEGDRTPRDLHWGLLAVGRRPDFLQPLLAAACDDAQLEAPDRRLVVHHP